MDWKSLITDLLALPMTVEDIAAEMGVTPNAVREITAGRTKSPRADAAFKLRALHEKRCVKTPRKRGRAAA